MHQLFPLPQHLGLFHVELMQSHLQPKQTTKERINNLILSAGIKLTPVELISLIPYYPVYLPCFLTLFPYPVYLPYIYLPCLLTLFTYPVYLPCLLTLFTYHF